MLSFTFASVLTLFSQDYAGDGPNRHDSEDNNRKQGNHEGRQNPDNDPVREYPTGPSHKATKLSQRQIQASSPRNVLTARQNRQ